MTNLTTHSTFKVWLNRSTCARRFVDKRSDPLQLGPAGLQRLVELRRELSVVVSYHVIRSQLQIFGVHQKVLGLLADTRLASISWSGHEAEVTKFAPIPRHPARDRVVPRVEAVNPAVRGVREVRRQ